VLIPLSHGNDPSQYVVAGAVGCVSFALLWSRTGYFQSSLDCRHEGMDIGALTPAERNIEGVVDMTLDAPQKRDRRRQHLPERRFHL
jgi:hypothetical protein